MNQPAAVPEISPVELQALLEAGDAPVLVDVRESFERAIADLPEHGQIAIPTRQFMQRISEIPKGREIVVYCRSGSRSEWATRLLLAQGHENVRNLTGGVLAWRTDVDPSLTSY